MRVSAFAAPPPFPGTGLEKEWREPGVNEDSPAKTKGDTTMKRITKTSTLLAGALFLAGTLALPADSQQSPGDAKAAQAGATRQLGPGDGTGNAGNGPKDGSGYGAPYNGGSETPRAGQGSGKANGAGPGNGTGNAGNSPKDGTGYGKSRGRGSSSGTCTGTGPQGSSGPASRASSGRRGGRG